MPKGVSWSWVVSAVQVVPRSDGWARCDCHMKHGLTSVRQRCSCGMWGSAVDVLFNWEVRGSSRLGKWKCCGDVVMKVNVDGDCDALSRRGACSRTHRHGATRIKAIVSNAMVKSTAMYWRPTA
eukprot:1132854-Amphidinium_carterae.1